MKTPLWFLRPTLSWGSVAYGKSTFECIESTAIENNKHVIAFINNTATPCRPTGYIKQELKVYRGPALPTEPFRNGQPTEITKPVCKGFLLLLMVCLEYLWTPVNIGTLNRNSANVTGILIVTNFPKPYFVSYCGEDGSNAKWNDPIYIY